jgi:tetratricopeptide (TPR) repeat protein
VAALQRGHVRAATTATTPLARWLVLALCVSIAPAARAHGSFHERLEQANAAIVARPGAAEPLLVRADLYRRHGDLEEALADVERAAALEPELVRVEYVRAETLAAAGRQLEAVAAYGRYLAVYPDHPEAREGRASALFALGRPLEAARDLDVAVAHQPVPLPGTYLARARALADAGDAYLDEAIAGLDAGIAVLGPVVALERAAIELELRRGAVDAALERLDRVRLRSPRQESWLARRGEILERAGRREEARVAYVEALAALEQLPPERRRNVAMRDLEVTLRAALRRVSASDG